MQREESNVSAEEHVEVPCSFCAQDIENIFKAVMWQPEGATVPLIWCGDCVAGVPVEMRLACFDSSDLPASVRCGRR
jgi:hypothetical protein